MSYETNARINRAVNGLNNNPAKDHTIRNFHKVARASRKKVMEAKVKADQEKAKLFDIYSNRLATEKAATVDAELRSFISDERKALEKLAGDIMTGKRNRFKEIALKAPSDEQIRMLQALQMRATSLTAAEVASVGELMADNHQALRSLAAIAEQSNIKVVVPAIVEEAEENFEEVEGYLANMISGFDAKNLNWLQTEFYSDAYTDIPKAGYIKVVVDAMDGTGFVAEQENPKTRVEILTEEAQKAFKKSDYEKSERIQKFIEENEERLLTAEQRLDRDMKLAIEGGAD